MGNSPDAATFDADTVMANTKFTTPTNNLLSFFMFSSFNK